MIAVGIISAVSVLAGSSLTWALNNITVAEAARRSEQAAIRHQIEEHYLSVLTSLESFLRTDEFGREVNKELSAMNAAVDLFANVEVKEKFSGLKSLISVFQDKVEVLSPRPRSLFHAGEILKQDWKELLAAKEKLAKAMCDHMHELQNFTR